MGESEPLFFFGKPEGGRHHDREEVQTGSPAQFDYSYNQPVTYNLNWLPVGTGRPFTPSNLNPTTVGGSSADIGSNFEKTIYPGLGGVTGWAWIGRTNYNGLNFTLNAAFRTVWHGA